MVEQKMEKIAQYADKIIPCRGHLWIWRTRRGIFASGPWKLWCGTTVFTSIAKKLGIKDNNTGLYPVTLEQMRRLMIGEPHRSWQCKLCLHRRNTCL